MIYNEQNVLYKTGEKRDLLYIYKVASKVEFQVIKLLVIKLQNWYTKLITRYYVNIINILIYFHFASNLQKKNGIYNYNIFYSSVARYSSRKQCNKSRYIYKLTYHDRYNVKLSTWKTKTFYSVTSII